MAQTTGLWNVAGINLPDFGLSEKLGIAPNALQSPNYGALNNDAFSQYTNQQYNNLQSIPQQVGTTTNGVTTYATNPAYTTAAAQNTATNTSRMANASANNNDWRSLPGYAGWDPKAAEADFAKTGGAGKGGSSGGNAGGSSKYTSSRGDTRANQIIADPTATQDFENSGMNMDDYLSSIDQEAAAQNAMLGNYETTANADKLAAEQNLAGQATQLKGTALTGKEDALSAARRLYSELQQGYKQRFGGASSAGEAAMALTGNEQQRQMAQTNRGYQDTINQIDQQSATALNTVQSEFRSRLDQINQNRTMVESQRLQARRGALQDLANKAFAIKQQQESFKQNLQLMQAQIDMQAKANGTKVFNVNPSSTLTPGAVATTASGNQGLTNVNNSVGQTSGLYKDEYLNSLFKQNPFNTGANYIK